MLGFVYRDRRRRSVALELETFLGNEDGVPSIGRAYLRLVPAENDVRLLSDLIFSDIRSDLLHGMDVRHAVAGRVQEDFREGRVVRLRGWLVSLTEARLCALVALGNSG